jgi:hypothetical protein
MLFLLWSCTIGVGVDCHVMDAYHTDNEHQCYVWAREHAKAAWFNHGVLAVDDKYFFVRDKQPGTFNGVYTCEPAEVELKASMLPDPTREASRAQPPQVTTGATHDDWIEVPNSHGLKVRKITKFADGVRRAVTHKVFASGPTTGIAAAEEYNAYDCEAPHMQENIETTVFNGAAESTRMSGARSMAGDGLTQMRGRLLPANGNLSAAPRYGRRRKRPLPKRRSSPRSIRRPPRPLTTTMNCCRR